MNLTDFDAKLYRLYAVGLIGYEQALSHAESVFRLRRAMLAFDQSARVSFAHEPTHSNLPGAVGARYSR